MELTEYKNLLVKPERETAWITVNRPDKLNALDRATVVEIGRAVRRACDDAEIAVIVITGAGDKAFAAGADIREMSGLAPAEAEEFSRFLQETLDDIETAPKPVLAAVNGFALGGGCELSMACHIRIAADTARFGQPEINLGLIPGAGGTQRLQRLVGRGRALDMILGGEMIDAAEAYRIGLVNRMVAASELRETVSAYADSLAKRSGVALARAMNAVLSGGDMSLAEAQRFEASLFGLCFATDDMREGTRAFLEKRKPRFTGR